jgi:ubiquinol oxidase
MECAVHMPAPQVAIGYWKPLCAVLRDVIVAVRADEMLHRDVNYQFADALKVGS